MICSSSISLNFGLDGPIPFPIACNELIHMEHLNQVFFPSKFVVIVL